MQDRQRQEIDVHMASKKPAKPKAPKSKGRANGQAPRKANRMPGYPQQAPQSYEETLLKRIISGRKAGNASEYSIIFNSALSGLTPGIKDVYYKSGFSVGRALYKLYHSDKRYVWYEESVADLVAFFERAGFSGITYNVFPDRIDLKFNNRDRTFLGTNVHVFESGIICGFLTAGKKQQVRVEEISCSNNGSDFCHFVTYQSIPHPESDGKFVLNRLINGIMLHLNGNYTKQGFADEYSALSSSVIMESAYSEHMSKILNHLGGEIASKSFKPTPNNLERLYELLGLGRLKVKSLRPLGVEIQFPMLKAKKEFVDISIAFLNGLLKDAIRKDSKINTKATKRNSSYVISITESKK